MNIGAVLLEILQVLMAVVLTIAIMLQTTKSESSAGLGGMGWGSIGGKSSSALGKYGSEAQIARITTWVAVGFLVVSFLTALVYMRSSGG